MFTLIKKVEDGTRARTGTITTPHGTIKTPVFMPVGTKGSVKAMTPEELEGLGTQIILGNTYHLYLRPGHERIKRLGGLHKFMHWDRPILTDSGGYQIFSLSDLRSKFTDDGVEFQSHLDGGERHFLTPELAIEIQETLASDIMMVLDECTPYPVDEKAARKSMELSLKWAARCLSALRSDNALFGIVQGSVYPALRREYIERLTVSKTKKSFTNGPADQRTSGPTNGFQGFAIGGLSVGEPVQLMYEMVGVCTDCLPEDKPRYLMGVGTPEDLVECIDMGIDMFDCVMPTRHGRNGSLFTSSGDINITGARFTDDSRPIDENCRCYACRNYSRAYIRHLFLSKEILASRLATLHNLHFYIDLVRQAALAVESDSYLKFKKNFLDQRKENVC